MQNQQPDGYSVWILRRDQSHIVAIETKSFEEADKIHKELTQKWMKALKDQSPLELRTPIITAFDPGLIYEINLVPFGTPNLSDNPYQQNMRQNGFSNTFGNSSKGNINNMLDSGYKY